MKHTEFIAELIKTGTEEDVKSIFARHFDLRYDKASRFDLYTPGVLFEFKLDQKMTQIKVRAAILAQTLYYIHQLKFGVVKKGIPPTICLADKNEAILTNTEDWKAFYAEKSGKDDWDLQASNPEPKLIDDLAKSEALRTLHVYRMQSPKDFAVFDERVRDAISTNSCQPSFRYIPSPFSQRAAV